MIVNATCIYNDCIYCTLTTDCINYASAASIIQYISVGSTTVFITEYNQTFINLKANINQYCAVAYTFTPVFTLNQISSSSSNCTGFGLQIDTSTGKVTSSPTVSVIPSQQCSITIGCSLNYQMRPGCSLCTISFTSSIFTLSNLCLSTTCASATGYSYAGVSTPSSITVYQNTGSSNQNIQAAVPITEYFTMPTTCTFSSCSLVQAVGTSSSQGTVNTIVTAAFSSNQIIFTINTASVQSLNLHLSCIVPSAAASGYSCAYSQYYVYSSNTITFNVANCYTALTHANLQYTQGASTTLSVLATDFISLANASECNLISCQMIDSTTLLAPSYINLLSSSNFSYSYNLNLTINLTSTLQFSCTGNAGTISSNNFGFTIICTPSACASASGYSFTGTSIPSLITVYQYSGSSNVYTQAAVSITQYFTMPTTCTFSSCSLVQAVGTSSSQGTVSTIVTAAYSSNQIIFTINSASVQSQTLHLSCLVPTAAASGSTCAYSQFYVYSSSTITFNIENCYTAATPASYNVNQGIGLQQYTISTSSFIVQKNSSCPLQSCKTIITGTGGTINLVQLSSTSYQISFDTVQIRSQQVYIQCSGYRGYIISNNFTVVVGYCTKNQIQPPSNIQNIYYIINEPGQVSSITIKNFTSSLTDCPILKHQLVKQSLSVVSPSYVNIQEKSGGASQFTISNKSMEWLSNTYSFYIYITAYGSTPIYHPITIQTSNDCSLDLVSINPSLPGDNEQMPNLYKLVNSLPVLFLNTTTTSPISVDISKRLSILFNTSCPLIQYKISKALIGSQVVDISTYGNYYQLSTNGVFSTLSTASSSIQNSQVYIQGYNGKIWGGDTQQYLIDITIAVQAQSNQSSPQKPTSSNNQTSQKQKSNQTQISNVNIRQSTFKYPKQVKKDLKKVDESNLTQVIQYLPVYFSKISIDKKGMMQIVFNQDLYVPDYAKALMEIKNNMSHYNQSHDKQSIEQLYNQYIQQVNISFNESYKDVIALKNIIEFSITINSLQDSALLNFTVELQDWTSKGMSIYLNFTNPTLVSTGSQYDQVNIKILNGSNFTSLIGSIPMIEYQDGHNQTNIQPQQPQFISPQLIQSIKTNSESLNIALIVIQVISQVLMKANMQLLYKLYLNMQYQQSFPVYQVNFPFRSQLYLDTEQSIVYFQFLKPKSILAMIGINIGTSNQAIASNAQRLGMTSLSIIDNLLIYIIITAAFLAIMLIIMSFYVFPCLRNHISTFVKNYIQKMKWNGVMRSITIGFLKICIGVSIYFQTLRQNIIQFEIYAFLQQIATLAIIVAYIIFVQMKLFLNSKNLIDKSFQKQFGFLVNGLKIQRISEYFKKQFPNKNAIYIYPCFLLYRFIYSMIPSIFSNLPGIQVQILIMITLAYIYFLAVMKSQLSFAEYYVDLYYEFMLLMMQLHMFWFMDGGILNGTPNQVSLQNYLWFQSLIDSTFIACGISIIVVGLCYYSATIVNNFIQFYKKMQNKFNKKNKYENKEKNSSTIQNKEISQKKKKQIFRNAKKILKIELQAQKNKIDLNNNLKRQQQIIEMHETQEILKENFQEIKLLVKANYNSKSNTQNQSYINQKLSPLKTTRKLQKLIFNPKIINNQSVMSEIQENQQEDSIIQICEDEDVDIDKIELQNLQGICGKYEFLFNTSQFKMEVDNECVTRKVILLEKYSVLKTDTANDIDTKMKMLYIDILKNSHLLELLPHPQQTFQQFEDDTQKYYQMKIKQIMNP